MLAGSGGNALHAAIGLCERVEVYGAGLYAASSRDDKVYAHAYDAAVGRCVAPGERKFEFGSWLGLMGLFHWRRDRVTSEIVLHVLHLLGIIRWVQ